MPLLARRAASATERTLVYFRMNMYIGPPMRLNSRPTHQSISGRCWTRAWFRDGSDSVVRQYWLDVRFARKRTQYSDVSLGPRRDQFRTSKSRRPALQSGLYFLPHQSNMPPMRPPVSNAFFCFASRLS
jgi:hypothetical protein